MTPEIDEFLKGPLRNGWVTLPYGEIYLRKTSRVFDEEIYLTLDIANVQFHERGKGRFTRLLDELEVELPNRGFAVIHVENIMEPRLAEFLKRRGYEEINKNSLTVSMRKML